MIASLPRLLRHLGRLAIVARARQDSWREWQRRLGGEPALPTLPLCSVLIVCHGNLCRSPFAAARLAARLPDLRVRSGGLAAPRGEPAAAAAIRAARQWGVSLEGHRTRPVEADDVLGADLVLAMEGHQLAELARRWPPVEARSRLLGDFLAEPPFAIEDPWGRPDAVFDAIFERLDGAVARLAERIEAERRIGDRIGE